MHRPFCDRNLRTKGLETVRFKVDRMKFSVLLPTRNRLELLKFAVETVRRQDYDDWEIVISDNCSKQDVAGYVRKIADSRIKYLRTERFVSVTDNWNNALEQSSGDYVVMLGDDDGLTKEYFGTMDRLTSQFAEPDVIYTSGYLFAYPGVIAGHPSGCLFENRARFLDYSPKPFFLDKNLAVEMVKKLLQFIVTFPTNMQYSTIKRESIEWLSRRGRFFQSPFPDYYATNVLFLKAARILVHPNPMVIIGISPKSYGYYFYNSREDEGAAFLGNEDPSSNSKALLPGSNINFWLAAMETVCANYGSEFGIRVDYRRYRALQIQRMLQSYYVTKTCSLKDFAIFKSRMRSFERFFYGNAMWLTGLIQQMKTALGIPRPLNVTSFFLWKWFELLAPQGFDQAKTRLYGGQFHDVLDVFEKVKAE
jgi:glycosyltransferase involved in cell wall biosynthesis